jgi:hypothetical protein
MSPNYRCDLNQHLAPILGLRPDILSKASFLFLEANTLAFPTKMLVNTVGDRKLMGRFTRRATTHVTRAENGTEASR